MAAAVDTESSHFFDTVCFCLEQPRGCAGALLLGLAVALTTGAGIAGLFCRWGGGWCAGYGATLVASKALGAKSLESVTCHASHGQRGRILGS